MSIYVNNGGVWKLSQDVYVKNAGVWVEPNEVYVKNAGVWVLSHKVITFAANAQNVNLFTLAGSPTSDVRLKVIINAGVTLSSSAVGTPALLIAGFNVNSKILLINNGSIIGAGGGGAQGSVYGGGFVNSAQAGGTAINTASATCGVTIQNYGTIAGGGGGGGQGGWGTYSVSSCFPKDTLINTPRGLIPIQNIKVGDEVYAFDAGIRWGLKNPTPLYNSELTARKVIEVSKHGYNDTPTPARLIKVIHTEGELVATYNHEVHSLTKQTQGSDIGFVRVEDLETGDIIFNTEGDQVTVIDIVDGEEYDYVYNLEVEELHTYIASGIRVHNGGTVTTTTTKKFSSTTTYTVAGSGGGGGAGNVVGRGGLGGSGTGAYNSIPGNGGANGSATAGGAGGSNTSIASYGGNGGALGGSGTTGRGGSYFSGGGAAGNYINGNIYVTWQVVGTRLGLAI